MPTGADDCRRMPRAKKEAPMSSEPEISPPARISGPGGGLLQDLPRDDHSVDLFGSLVDLSDLHRAVPSPNYDGSRLGWRNPRAARCRSTTTYAGAVSRIEQRRACPPRLDTPPHSSPTICRHARRFLDLSERRAGLGRCPGRAPNKRTAGADACRGSSSAAVGHVSAAPPTTEDGSACTEGAGCSGSVSANVTSRPRQAMLYMTYMPS